MRPSKLGKDKNNCNIAFKSIKSISEI
jgi:hypothetical protein